MQIEIHIPRSLLTLTLGALLGWGATAWMTGDETQLTAAVVPVAAVSSSSATPAVGGTQEPVTIPDYSAAVSASSQAEGDAARTDSPGEDLQRGRMEQEVLQHKADILRGQLRILEAERTALGDKVDPTLEEQFRASARILASLIQDQQKADEFLLTVLNQIWEAQGRAMALGEEAEDGEGPAVTALAWPVAPRLGISASFHDPSYEERFGFPHDAVDVPVLQGAEVRAAADGVVKDVADHGLGFSYITIRHAGGLVTLYGHLSKFKVQSGARVAAGDVIGLSGGRPGTMGAGLSTGPHLHFGVFTKGVAVNPMEYLPSQVEGAGE